MCGIFAIFSRDGQPLKPRRIGRSVYSLRELAYKQSGKQRHRGPDDTGVALIAEHGVVLVHERLSIIGPETGHQPLTSDDGQLVLVANGEIYNYLEQSAEIAKRRGHYKPKTDCNVIIELYEEHGARMLHHITGMYSFVLYDRRTRQILIARDPIGIIPLYIGEDAEGNVWVASEMKCLIGHCPQIRVFQPGEMMHGTVQQLQRHKYFAEPWQKQLPTLEADLSLLRYHLESAVRSHLASDVPFGALLSGGVDSSLIAAIATKIRRERDPSFRLRTFSVGLKGAPDFKAARLVADHIGSDHTEVVFDIADALDNVRDIIYHLETHDTTTIRCGLPMLMLARYIKSTGIKMILSGEGADELFGGYLYFHQAPNPEELHWELVKRVHELHVSDCLRANKVPMAKGLEVRVPFLDKAFVNYVMAIRPEDKMPGRQNCYGGVQRDRLEKYILRAAFADDYLPAEVLWRQKEQFSDGVGYAWIDSLRQVATDHVSDEEFAERHTRFPDNTPSTKEAFYYRCVFDEMFPGEAASSTVERWLPRLDWGCPEDPSGRAQTVHSHAYSDTAST